MYREGIRFFIGRVHAAAVLPKVTALIESGKLEPGRVTTSVVGRDDSGAGPDLRAARRGAAGRMAPRLVAAQGRRACRP
jgi:hypothetical protein